MIYKIIDRHKRKGNYLILEQLIVRGFGRVLISEWTRETGYIRVVGEFISST